MITQKYFINIEKNKKQLNYKSMYESILLYNAQHILQLFAVICVCVYNTFK